VSLAVRKHLAAKTDVKAIKFITCATANPPKQDVLAYLGIPLVTGEKAQVSKIEPLRRADVDVSEPLCVLFTISDRVISSSTW
jgi:primary-amine oxidase